MTLKEHIEDQKHRYQTVSLSLEQADIVLKLIDGAVDQAIELAEKRVLKRKITPETKPVAWRWRYKNAPDMEWVIDDDRPDEKDTNVEANPLIIAESCDCEKPSQSWNEAMKALLAYQQADDDGVMVLTSRQAIHEVVDQVSSLRHLLEMVWDANQSDPHIPEPALTAIRAALDGVGTPEPYVLPFHGETMAALNSLTIRKDS